MMAASVGDLSVDVLANIFEYLNGTKEIIHQRRVSKKWKEAVRMTVIPCTNYFWVSSVGKYNAMNVMTTEMPNLQKIKLSGFGYRHKYNDGEDPNERLAAGFANWTTHDIEIISNFRNLRALKIVDSGLSSSLNGIYPVLFNFPLLQKLSIEHCDYLKWDLDMLAGMPLLKELECICNNNLTSSINSLRVLKDTLEKVNIYSCRRVEGNFMDLEDFPHLRELDLLDTAVTGDIRNIGENDFSSLECLHLPKGVYGGRGYEFRRIADGPDLIRAVYLLKKQRPMLKMNDRCRWFGRLSEDSPGWYRSVDEDNDTPPFYIHFVEAGSRIGYRWETSGDTPCEVNWLDPEPESDSSDYGKYIEELQEIEDQVTSLYRGYYEPPTEEQYTLLYEEYLAEIHRQRDDEDY